MAESVALTSICTVAMSVAPLGSLNANANVVVKPVPEFGETETVAGVPAVVVTVHDPPNEFLYWGLTLTSPWGESYDYRYATTHLNNKTANRSPDGSWRMVIAPSDPGVENALRHLGEIADFLRVLGCYPAWRPRT